MQRTHIFCKVIDNFGDLGVCWRLARQLAVEQHHAVTLWVDDWPVVERMTLSTQPQAIARQAGELTWMHWSSDQHLIVSLTPQHLPIDWLIEGFACRLPEELLAQVAKQTPPAHWINLEYLSAEDWIKDCHGLSSPHPRIALSQHFFFPSVWPHSGGLLRETDLLTQIETFQQSPVLSQQFWQQYGINSADFALKISLFAYPHVPIAPLLDQLSQHDSAVLLAMTDSGHRQPVQAWLTSQQLEIPASGQTVSHGALTLLYLPFMNHQHFDQLLWACDLNLIRGEDSCVRAMWAAQSWLWHIYPQADDAHQDKLSAMIAVMRQILQGHDDAALHSWLDALWTYGMSEPTDWSALLADLPRIHRLSQLWQQYLADQSDLVQRLLQLSAK